MTQQYATVSELRRTISTEILVATGVPRTGPLQTLLSPLVCLPAQRFARYAAEFDRRVVQSGLTEAVRWALPQLLGASQAYGTEQLPAKGPLIVASNHPGSYDSLVIISSLARDDLKILVSDVPFLRNMHGTWPYLIYTDKDTHSRMAVVRESARHLRAGGALLVFASAQVDPDPALLPGAEEAIDKWSSSLPLLLRQEPKTKVLVTIVSGVLAPSCYRHPLTRLHKEQRMRQFLAEFIQISQQVLFGRRFALTPVVRFSAPLTASELGDIRDSQAVMATVKQQARELLALVPPHAESELDAP